MNFELTHLPSLNIAGISIRTANAGGRAQKEIGELWQKFTGQQILQNIPNRVNDDIYCMYTEYESDANAEYTTIIGCRVNDISDLPPDISGWLIPGQLYRLYNTETPGNIMATWMHIWQSDIDRAYAADFDVYKQDGSVETYLSV